MARCIRKPWTLAAALLTVGILGVLSQSQLSTAQDTKKVEEARTAKNKGAEQPSAPRQPTEELPPAFQKIVDDNKELRDALRELANHHEELKSEYEATKRALKAEISKTN